MLNVLHLIHYPGSGNSEKYILSLVEKLHNKECRFFLGYSVDGPLVDKLKALGVETIQLSMRRPYDLRAAFKLKALCHERCIDLVHTHFLRENYVSVLSKVLGNRVILVHTHHLLQRGSFAAKLSHHVLSRLNDRITVVSAAVKDQLTANGINPYKIEVIYHGLGVGHWKQNRSYTIRDELGISHDDFLAVSTADFNEEKGHVFLLEAIREFKRMDHRTAGKDLPGVKFLLVGEGEMLEECRRFRDMLGLSRDVVFTGHRDDIQSILHGSDLLISHYNCEGLDAAIPEALLCGLPVLATRSGSTEEIINRKSNCGVLVEYGDTEAFADRLWKLVKDKRFFDKLRKNAVNAVDERFDIENTVKKTYEVYIQSLRAGYG